MESTLKKADESKEANVTRAEKVKGQWAVERLHGYPEPA